MRPNTIATDSQFDQSQLQAQIAAFEAELALYAFKYGLTNEARRLLAARLQDVDFHPELSRIGAYFSLRTELCEPFPNAVSSGGTVDQSS